jgi:hypothetical protein
VAQIRQFAASVMLSSGYRRAASAVVTRAPR